MNDPVFLFPDGVPGMFPAETYQRLCAWAMRAGPSRGVPEDESLLILHDLILELRDLYLAGDQRFEPYLRYRFCGRCAGYYRDMIRRRERDDQYASTMEDLPHAPPADSRRYELGENLQQALNQLEMLDQRILHLLHWNDLSSEAIATLLKEPVGTIRSRICRAHGNLHRLLTGSNRPRRRPYRRRKCRRNQRRASSG